MSQPEAREAFPHNQCHLNRQIWEAQDSPGCPGMGLPSDIKLGYWSRFLLPTHQGTAAACPSHILPHPPISLPSPLPPSNPCVSHAQLAQTHPYLVHTWMQGGEQTDTPKTFATFFIWHKRLAPAKRHFRLHHLLVYCNWLSNVVYAPSLGSGDRKMVGLHFFPCLISPYEVTSTYSNSVSVEISWYWGMCVIWRA